MYNNMTITYKYIAVQSNSNSNTEIIHKDDLGKPTINYEDVINYFLKLGKSYNLNSDDINNIKFIIEKSKNMSNEPKMEFVINNQDEKGSIIFVFSTDKETKNKLLKIFNEKVMDESICKSIPEEELVITDDIIEESNKTTIELFKNEDFKSLLKIYKTNPSIFKTFSSYVCNGDVHVTSFDSKIPEIDKASVEKEFNYIKELDLGINEEDILNSLKIFKGHINLSLRYLLYNETL